MQRTTPAYSSRTDLAGIAPPSPHLKHIQPRIQGLILSYLSFAQLDRHLTELPQQFVQPTTRPWQPIEWQHIDQTQIIGLEPDIFLAILLGATETEAPIRDYTQTSRQYLSPVHPQMAAYVGGNVATDGTLIEPGLWEKEERQHTPALLKIYRQLTGQKAEFDQRTVRAYHPTGNPVTDLYRHGLHRISTEYGAVCLYLWMMTHTTGPLQAVLAELLRDEINHMTKFWGFGLWLFSESHWQRTRHIVSLVTHRPKATSAHRLRHTLNRMKGVLHWHHWQRHHQVELALTFSLVLYQIHRWSCGLTPSSLSDLLGESPINAV